MDLIDLIKQIYELRELSQKVFSDADGKISELKELLQTFIELSLPRTDSEYKGKLVIEKHIGEPRPIPPWLRLTGIFPFMDMHRDEFLVDSLALRVEADFIEFRLKLWFEVASTIKYRDKEDGPGKTYDSFTYSIALYRDVWSAVPLMTLLLFAWLTKDEDWEYIMSELKRLAENRAELDKVISQLKTAITALKLMS